MTESCTVCDKPLPTKHGALIHRAHVHGVKAETNGHKRPSAEAIPAPPAEVVALAIRRALFTAYCFDCARIRAVVPETVIAPPEHALEEMAVEPGVVVRARLSCDHDAEFVTSTRKVRYGI